jgi:hypothetical protein
MNLWWEVFGVADTALGGWIANVARLFTVVIAILLTVYKDRFWKPRAIALDPRDPRFNKISVMPWLLSPLAFLARNPATTRSIAYSLSTQ